MITSTKQLDISPGTSPRWGVHRMRLEATERVLVVAEILSESRLGMTLDELQGETCERMATSWCERTIRRTCELLERMGRAEQVDCARHGRFVIAPTKWRYVGRPLLPAGPPIETAEMRQLRDVNELLRGKLREANELIQRLQSKVVPTSPPPMLPRRQPSAAVVSGCRPGVAHASEAHAALMLLSDRQRQILDLLAAGLSSAEIGQRLGMATTTVDTQRSRIRKRLGITSPDGLIRLAVMACDWQRTSD